MYTQQEAETKWCPLARQSPIRPQQTTPANRDDAGQMMQGSACIGSGCMMWRDLPTGTGYCGLAGVP